MAGLPYDVVDVFTDTPYAGNPLAVVLDSDDLPMAALQALAREFQLSETAFPQRPDRADADYRLRIFTPQVELPFAGHPSVGTAWVLARRGRVSPGVLRQSCGAGLLSLTVAPGPGRVQLTGGTPRAGAPVPAEPLLAAVGLSPADLAGPAPRACGAGLDFGYLCVRDDAVARAEPDHRALRRLAGSGAAPAGLSVFGWAAGVAHARVFAAEVGVSEDPATGSAALGLGVWLVAAGLLPGEGESAYVVRQGGEIGRPATLDCGVEAAGGRARRVRVAGSVVPIASGEIVRPPTEPVASSRTTRRAG